MNREAGTICCQLGRIEGCENKLPVRIWGKTFRGSHPGSLPTGILHPPSTLKHWLTWYQVYLLSVCGSVGVLHPGTCHKGRIVTPLSLCHNQHLSLRSLYRQLVSVNSLVSVNRRLHEDMCQKGGGGGGGLSCKIFISQEKKIVLNQKIMAKNLKNFFFPEMNFLIWFALWIT